MSKTSILIYGASGHARVVTDIILLSKKYDIVGYIDDTAEKKGEKFENSRILGTKDLLDDLKSNGIKKAFVAVGDNKGRSKICKLLLEKGFELINLIHPKAVVAKDVKIGFGVVVMAGAIINSGSTIGNNVIVNTGATVDHDCNLMEGAHISPGVHLAGGVDVGRLSWVGIGSIVKDKMKIGDNCIVGAGSLVLDNIQDNMIAFGAPAKVIKKMGTV